MTNPQGWLERCSSLLAQRKEKRLLRQLHAIEPLDAVHLKSDGRGYVNFSSNDYLGLTHHPRMLEAIRNTPAAGSGAAGLITGYTALHARAEEQLATWKGMEAALLLPSGYQANQAAVQALAGVGEAFSAGVRFLIDKLSHASLIDAARSTGAPMRVFPHNGMEKLTRLLEEAEPEQLQIVLTESIFSMDGDAADLSTLAELKRKYGFVLLLDEAHGSGVYGQDGAGFAAEQGLSAIVDVSIVTLSKALGCGGGAIGSTRIFKDVVLNLGRAYIYSTSLPPMVPACVEAALSILRDEPYRQVRVRSLAKRVREELIQSGFEIPAGDSPIIPIILGGEQAVLDASQRFREAGLWVVGVRPPTVPPGGSRLRVTVSCEHSDEEIAGLLREMRKLTH